jgi:hypothetical protein
LPDSLKVSDWVCLSTCFKYGRFFLWSFSNVPL